MTDNAKEFKEIVKGCVLEILEEQKEHSIDNVSKKEQILAIASTTERQKAISENIDLF